MITGFKLPGWAIAALVFPLLCLNGWLLYRMAGLLQPIPSIVVTASLIAFLLDYPIDLLEDRGVNRGLAVALVGLLAVGAIALLVVFLGPLLWQQLNDFADRLPRWIEKGKTELLLIEQRPFFQNLPVDLKQITVNSANQLSGALQSATSQTITLALSTIDSTLNLLVTVVVTLLLTISGEPLWRGLLGWLPERWQTRIRQSLQPSFRGYFTGQATLALILAAAQSAAFVLLGVPFGLLFGLGIGLASLIPFGGTVAVLGVSTLLIFQDVGLGLKVLGVAVVLGQINDNLVAPRLMGGITGLNPAVIVLVLLVGTKLGGFLGLLLAVPTASFLKRLIDAVRTDAVKADTQPT